MPPATKRRQLGMIARSPLQLVALLILLALSSSTAALFGRNNNKVVVDPPPTTGGDEKDDAVSNAKRLVDELNSAAMGTVTTYDSSSTKREKEPATCDSIMAKSLVLANEEKAAVAAQLDSVVKAAGLLSTQIEDLYSSLDVAGGEIAALRKELEDKMEEFQGEVDARERRAAERVAEVERALADARSEHATAIKAIEEDVERSLLVEREASKVKIDALRNTTADAISLVEREAKLRIAKLEKSLNDAEARHSSITAEMRKDTDARMDSCMAKSDMDRESIMKHANDQIEAAKGQARRELDLKTKEINDIHDEHQTKLSDLMKSHAEKIERLKQTMDNEMKKMAHAMEVAIAQKDLILSEERGENERLRSRMNELITEAASLQKSLRGDLELARTSSFELEKEVSFWKETHEQQGYCNTTLIKEDSRRLVMNAFDGASRGLDSVHEILNAQVETLQKTGADVMQYIEKDLLPAVERVIAEARDKVAALYAKYLEGPVTENLLPLYNERIYPIYNQNILPAYVEHVSPVVRRIESEAAVAIQKSHDGARMAHSQAVALVRETSNVVLEKDKQKKMLPNWLYGTLNKASLDPDWAVEKLTRAVIVLVIILSRSIIFRVIGMVFSLFWFFCPLRFLVGGRSKKTGENGAKKDTKGEKSRTNGNGKAKVH